MKYLRNNTFLTLACIAIPLCFSCCNKNSAKAKTDLEELGLKGNIKSLLENTYEYTGSFESPIRGNGLPQEVAIHFNKEGNIIIRNNKSSINLKFLTTYTYDDKARKKSEVSQTFFQQGNPHITKSTYHYDQKGNLIEIKTFNEVNDLIYKSVMKFDNNGNKIEESEIYADGTINRNEKFKYDSKNILIESQQVYKGRMENKSEYIYDNNNRLTDDTWYDPNGVLAGKITIGYDNSGNQIEYSQLEKDGSYLLNYLYKYKFDNMGNWIERISSNKGQPYEFCTRKIEYY